MTSEAPPPSYEELQAAAALGTTVERLREALAKLSIKVGVKPERSERRYWLVKYKGFSTVVTFLEADDLDSAQHVAFGNPYQPWYPSEAIVDGQLIETKMLTHSEYCNWLKAKNST